jgi:hypothetical protein
MGAFHRIGRARPPAARIYGKATTNLPTAEFASAGRRVNALSTPRLPQLIAQGLRRVEHRARRPAFGCIYRPMVVRYFDELAGPCVPGLPRFAGWHRLGKPMLATEVSPRRYRRACRPHQQRDRFGSRTIGTPRNVAAGEAGDASPRDAAGSTADQTASSRTAETAAGPIGSTLTL